MSCPVWNIVLPHAIWSCRWLAVHWRASICIIEIQRWQNTTGVQSKPSISKMQRGSSVKKSVTWISLDSTQEAMARLAALVLMQDEVPSGSFLLLFIVCIVLWQLHLNGHNLKKYDTACTVSMRIEVKQWKGLFDNVTALGVTACKCENEVEHKATHTYFYLDLFHIVSPAELNCASRFLEIVSICSNASLEPQSCARFGKKSNKNQVHWAQLVPVCTGDAHAHLADQFPMIKDRRRLKKTLEDSLAICAQNWHKLPFLGVS